MPEINIISVEYDGIGEPRTERELNIWCAQKLHRIMEHYNRTAPFGDEALALFRAIEVLRDIR